MKKQASLECIRWDLQICDVRVTSDKLLEFVTRQS